MGVSPTPAGVNSPPTSPTRERGGSSPAPAGVNAWSADYLEAEYERFKSDPASIPADMRSFFQGFDLALARGDLELTKGDAGAVREALRLQYAVSNLIDSYRRRGHLVAQLDPFGRARPRPSVLTLAYYGLTDADLDRVVSAGDLPVAEGSTLRVVIEQLERLYCGTIGAHFMHVTSDTERQWLTKRFERPGGLIELTRGQRAHILEQLVRAEQFETFLGMRYPGDKRFSLEGGESLIPLLDRLIEAAADSGVEQMLVGMSHRGRLNVLNNTLGKTYEQIFTEFEDNWDEAFVDGGGDVKYHRGYSGDRELRNGKTIHLSLNSNPSHLESVNAVVLGRCRAQQRLVGDTVERRRVLPVLVHGDAAVIAQGVVAECLNLSQLEGYRVGGTVHVVVNNLIGFTTTPEDARTSTYCTDIGLMVETPVFHVNGEDPEAVVGVAQIAMEYRQTFKKDVFIDMYCYRKYGHNEQDETSFTQPVMAALIKAKIPVLSSYAARLHNEGVITDQDLHAIRMRLLSSLEAAQAEARANPKPPNIEPGRKRWKGFESEYSFSSADTGVSERMLREVCAAWARTPDEFNVNPKIRKLLADRAALVDTGAISYADAESLAFGTLLLEGHGVRLSGQDSRRGTFSHRHAVLRDVENGTSYVPLNNMRHVPELPDDAGKPMPDGRPTQGRFSVYDSPLSEASVLGFDYGYSMADPRTLVLWEAQFGDFANGAQVMVDQYLASAELKWDRWSGIVLLLPHGYEGAGPEHSSARLERFLQLCANENMEIVYPSTGAQAFHMFRRAVKRNVRKPLIVMTPKSMLRVVTSTVNELMHGRFMEVIDDPMFAGPAGTKLRAGVQKIVLCTGKIYHELAARRDAVKNTDTGIVRLEQLYPLHAEMLKGVLASYPAANRIVWAQEEPRNKGAWTYISDALASELGLDGISYVGRPASATPAVGSKHKHKDEQETILAAVFGPAPRDTDPAKAPDRSTAAPQPAAPDHANATADVLKKTAAHEKPNGAAAHRDTPPARPSGVGASKKRTARR